MDFRELFWFKLQNKTCVLEISDSIFRIAVLCLFNLNKILMIINLVVSSSFKLQ